MNWGYLFIFLFGVFWGRLCNDCKMQAKHNLVVKALKNKNKSQKKLLKQSVEAIKKLKVINSDLTSKCANISQENYNKNIETKSDDSVVL